MPTKPHEAILYRELSKVEVIDTIEIASKLLKEQVNFGTNALVRCITSANGEVDVDLAIFALYRHMIEMTDGIEVLISQACVIPALPLLRSSFESYLSIDYILESELEYKKRSLSWLVGYTHERLNMYERLDPSTNKGKELKKVFDDDQIASTILPLEQPLQEENKKAIANLLSFLTKDHIKPIDSEYNRFRNPKWHRLFDGPKSTRDLAIYLKKGGFYELFYRSWSRTSHAQDLLSFIRRTSEGESAIGKIRDTKEMTSIAGYASTLLLGATRMAVKKFRPEEDLSGWFKREIFEYRKAIRAA